MIKNIIILILLVNASVMAEVVENSATNDLKRTVISMTSNVATTNGIINIPEEKSVAARCQSKAVYATCFYGLKRGFSNILTGWLEVPRGISYQLTSCPLSAPIVGPITGASLAITRLANGAIDITTLGFGGYYKYSEMQPDFVWQSDWISATTNLD